MTGSDDDRSARLSNRFATADEDATDENDENEANDENDAASQDSTGEEATVRDTVGRTIYAGEETFAEVDTAYKHMDIRWSEEHGEDLPKNKVFYPALLRAGVNGTSVAEELGLEDEE